MGRPDVEASAAGLMSGPGFDHVALLYKGGDEYASEVSAFVIAALACGDAVLVAVPRFRARVLGEAIGPDWRRVTFADMTEIGRNPGRIIPAVRAFADAHPGMRVSVVGEPAWASRSVSEFREIAKHEALSNLAFADAPISVLCAYDMAALPDRVLAEAQQTHPLLAQPGGSQVSVAYLGPGQVPPRCLEPLPEPPPGADMLSYRNDLRPVRALAGHRAARAGLSRDRAADLVIAVSELAANTLRHTPQHGVLRIWSGSDELICEISDRGWITDPLADRIRPAGDDPGGHGLWLVHHVCDLVEVRTGPEGTTIRLHMRVPRPPRGR